MLMTVKFIAASLVVLLLSCKKEYKYPEDPKKSRATPEQRLKGRWEIIEYTFQANSIYGKLNQAAHGIFNLDKIVLEYADKARDNYDQGIATLNPVGGDNSFFISKNNFKFYTPNANDSTFIYWFVSPFRYKPATTANWTITKLYGVDFNIVLPTDSGEYKIFWHRVN
jgi:hypothetical protein